jgi:hypothetical protein
MRNTILALAAAGSLTLAALTPALAVGLICSDSHNLDRCPISGVYGNPTPASSYHAPHWQIRHGQIHNHGRYLYNG